VVWGLGVGVHDSRSETTLCDIMMPYYFDKNDIVLFSIFSLTIFKYFSSRYLSILITLFTVGSEDPCYYGRGAPSISTRTSTILRGDRGAREQDINFVYHDCWANKCIVVFYSISFGIS